MTVPFISVALVDSTTPGAGGWLALAAWFVLFVLVVNTAVFGVRRLFRRRGKAASNQGERQA